MQDGDMFVRNMGVGHCVQNGTAPTFAKLSSLDRINPPRRCSRPVVFRAASTSQSQIVDVKRLKGIRMRPRTPEDDEKKDRITFDMPAHIYPARTYALLTRSCARF